jgi:hypothetical protein
MKTVSNLKRKTLILKDWLMDLRAFVMNNEIRNRRRKDIKRVKFLFT